MCANNVYKKTFLQRPRTLCFGQKKKRLVSLFIATVFLLAPVQGFSAYLIKLNNGNTITTNACWEEDGFIKFYIYGGVAGIRKNTIKSIKKPGQESIDMPELPTHKETSTSNATEEKKNEFATPKKQDKIDPIIQKVRLLKIKTSTISILNAEELNNLYKDILSLKQRLFKERRDIVYQDQIKELTIIADTVENAINQKNQ